MKKISCILLVSMLLMQLIPIGGQAAEVSDNRKLDTLIGLDILAGYSAESFNEDAYVSSGVFVNAVLNLIQDDEIFDSAATEHSIAVAKNLDLLDGFDNFQKQRSIKTEQALNVLVRALGYKILMDNGASAIEAATQIGLSAGGRGADDPITYGLMIKLLYDALEVHPLIFDMKSYSQDTDSTILGKFKDIVRIEGIVSQNSYTALTSANVSGDADIVIGGVKCYVSKIDYDDLLGMYVEAYIKETDDGYSLVYARPWKNELFTLDREDVISIDDSYTNLSYEVNKTVKKLKISPTVKVIYNGIAYTAYEKADFEADNGQITFIDNDHNGVYDVVKITAYRTMVVKSVSAFDGVIINKYTHDEENKSITLDFQSDDMEYVIVKDGRIVTINEIMAGDVLQIAEPKSGDNRKTFIYASSTKVEGDVTGVSNEDNFVTLGEKEYTLSDEYILAASDSCYTALKLGNYYRLYLDAFGKVVFVEERMFNVTSYGYMNKILNDEDEERYYIQVFATDGMWYKYPLRKYVSYNTSRTADFAVFSDLTDGNNKLRQAQMIRYRVNKNGEINVLDTAQAANSYVKDKFTQRAISENEFRSEANMLLESEIYLDANTVVMMIPESATDKTSYAVKNLSWLTNGRDVTCTVYDVDEWSKAKLITIVNDASANSKAVENSDLCVVESVKQVIDSDDMVCQQVVLYQPFYGKVTLLSDDKNHFTGVRPGDVIQVATDINSRVTAARVVYSVSDGERQVWSSSGNFRNATTMLAGEVLDVDAERRLIKMNCGETHILPLAPADYYRKLDVIIYDTSENKVEIGSIYDIREGDYVVADMSWYLIGNLVIYR